MIRPKPGFDNKRDRLKHTKRSHFLLLSLVQIRSQYQQPDQQRKEEEEATMGDLAKKYMLQLQLHPLRTKAITAGVLAGVSDSIAQKLSGIQRLQLKRLLLKMLFGFAYLGPFGHFLHKMLDKIFKGKKDTGTVAKKVLIEQLTASPWNNMMFLFYYGLVVEGRPFVQVRSKVRKDYPSVQLASWSFWPVVGWINHQYMPLQFRVIFHSLIACGWGIFLNLRARTMVLPKSK